LQSFFPWYFCEKLQLLQIRCPQSLVGHSIKLSLAIVHLPVWPHFEHLCCLVSLSSKLGDNLLCCSCMSIGNNTISILLISLFVQNGHNNGSFFWFNDSLAFRIKHVRHPEHLQFVSVIISSVWRASLHFTHSVLLLLLLYSGFLSSFTSFSFCFFFFFFFVVFFFLIFFF